MKDTLIKYIKRHGSSFAVIATAICLSALTYAPEAAYTVKEVIGIETSGEAGHASPPEISAENAILIDADTGRVLYEKNADEKAYPASTTKIMTSLIAIEKLEELKSPLDQEVLIPSDAAGIEGSSIYLEAGEKVRIIDLIYGAMLRSGNDAATALAIIIGGSEEEFVRLMNERASEMGLEDTNFTNPTGLFDENHYTTARDLATISKISIKNGTFREVSASKEYKAERDADKYNYFYNKNKTVHQYDGGNGIKIGYTEKSGRTLVASAEREGKTLICVVLEAPCWFDDAYALLDYGFSQSM